MDMYLTDSKGERLTIPILPDRLSVKTGVLTQSFQIINLGEMRTPRGVTLTGYSFSGMFPGADMQQQVESFGRVWEKPDALITRINEWVKGGEKLRLLLTETSVNDDVYIDSFNYDYFGTGHVSYTLNLNKWPVLTVTTAPAPAKPTEGTGTSEGEDDGKTYGIVVTSGGKKLYVRKGTGSQYEIIDYYENGKRIEILGITGNWYITPHEKGTNGKGYVYKTYVKLEGTLKGTGTGSSGTGTGSGSSGTGSTSKSGGGSGGSSAYTYKTKSGDSLTSIAKMFGVTILDLWNLNAANIKKAGGSMSNIPAGIILQIPAAKKTTTTAKSQTSTSGTSKTKLVVTSSPSSRILSVAKTTSKKAKVAGKAKASTSAAKKKSQISMT